MPRFLSFVRSVSQNSSATVAGVPRVKTRPTKLPLPEIIEKLLAGQRILLLLEESHHLPGVHIHVDTPEGRI